MTSLENFTVAVAGLGPMGRGIARVFDRAGADVVVSDISPEATAIGLERIRQEAAADGDTVAIASGALPSSLERSGPVHRGDRGEHGRQGRHAGKVRGHGREDLIVASNTSSLSIGEMGKAFGDPSRVVGMHFFNPPTKMRLVEVIRGAATSDAIHRRVVALVRPSERRLVTCADSPNFVVNRICRPLYYEAQLLAMQGLEPATVDAVARGGSGPPDGSAGAAGLHRSAHPPGLLGDRPSRVR